MLHSSRPPHPELCQGLQQKIEECILVLIKSQCSYPVVSPKGLSLSLGMRSNHRTGASTIPFPAKFRQNDQRSHWFPELKRLRVEISGHTWLGPELCCIAVQPIGVIPGHSQDGPVMAWLETIGNLLVHRIGKHNLKKYFFIFETILLCDFWLTSNSQACLPLLPKCGS